MSKRKHYASLVQSRKTCTLCEGLTNPSCSKLRHLDSTEIGPWSLLFGELDADIMIVGQDWGDVSYFTKHQGRDDLNTPTNRNLLRILAKSGLHRGSGYEPESQVKMFWTNAILCLKNGGLQAKVEQDWFDNCGPRFLRRQIEIIRPRVVVALGSRALHACLDAFSIERVPLSQAVDDRKGIDVFLGVRLFAVYHCGARTMAINRSFDLQVRDWKRIVSFLRSGR